MWFINYQKNHPINGFKSQKYFLQPICATSMCDSIPLLYPEGILFTSILYAMVTNNDSICGSIISSLLTEIKSINLFDNTYDHTKRGLTSVSIAIITNPTYESNCYDKLTNLSLNHEDNCIVLNRLLTVDTESTNGIGVICNNYYSIFESIYNKQMVSKLCAPQKYHKMDIFLTFT